MSEQTTVVGFSQQLIGFLTASHPTLAADFGNDINSIAVYTANIDEFRKQINRHFHGILSGLPCDTIAIRIYLDDHDNIEYWFMNLTSKVFPFLEDARTYRA